MTCHGKHRPEVYQTEVYQLPPEPPVGSVVVEVPDIGGPFWTRGDEHPTRGWRQSKHNDHRRMTWGEVLVMAGGQVQLLPWTNYTQRG